MRPRWSLERKRKCEKCASVKSQIELAARWRISPRTLERWRWIGDGPRFMKLGGRVIYRLEDVLAFENQELRDLEEIKAGR
ncbi:helix-turn-helix transcriptional regulator [Tropicibacter naphthalenivorans]|uniref:helix-turn-helix transcriptional regulator n=1 Tax=Tropicibacter naphthalenivorans TaxID=441103 RepID=UPI00071DA303|nr:helix-turn-helix domain-containing protein [Tropicibacter naphthalenivorans]